MRRRRPCCVWRASVLLPADHPAGLPCPSSLPADLPCPSSLALHCPVPHLCSAAPWCATRGCAPAAWSPSCATSLATTWCRSVLLVGCFVGWLQCVVGFRYLEMVMCAPAAAQPSCRHAVDQCQPTSDCAHALCTTSSCIRLAGSPAQAKLSFFPCLSPSLSLPFFCSAPWTWPLRRSAPPCWPPSRQEKGTPSVRVWVVPWCAFGSGAWS